MLPSPLAPSSLRSDLPLYPAPLQALRVTGGTVPGPSGYMSSSVLGPSLYVAFVQQLHPTTLLPRDREPCLALDLNGYGLAPGYYTNCRLAGSYQSLPVYEVGGAPVSPAGALSSYTGLTAAQSQALTTLSPAQIAVLSNLTPCQLQTVLDAVPISQVHTLTSGVITRTQLQNLVNFNTSSQLTTIYNQLTTSQVIKLSTALNQQQFQNITQATTSAQLLSIVLNLTDTQIQTLAGMTPQQIKTLLTNLTVAQLVLFLNVSPLPAWIPPGVSTQTGTTYTITAADLARLILLNNPSAIAVTIPSASSLGAGWYTTLQNIGAGTATLTPTSGNINGAASLAIPTMQGAVIVSDGTNWQVSTPVAGATLSTGARTEGPLTAAGTTQGTAAAIVTDAVVVSGADGTKGVILPNTAAAVVVVYNSAAVNSLNVYPHSGAAIGVNATNIAESLGGSQRKIYTRVSSTQWYGVLLS